MVQHWWGKRQLWKQQATKTEWTNSVHSTTGRKPETSTFMRIQVERNKRERHHHKSLKWFQGKLKLWIWGAWQLQKKKFWPGTKGHVGLGPSKTNRSLQQTTWHLNLPGWIPTLRCIPLNALPLVRTHVCFLSQAQHLKYNAVNKLSKKFQYLFLVQKEGHLLLFTCLHWMYYILQQKKKKLLHFNIHM